MDNLLSMMCRDAARSIIHFADLEASQCGYYRLKKCCKSVISSISCSIQKLSVWSNHRLYYHQYSSGNSYLYKRYTIRITRISRFRISTLFPNFPYKIRFTRETGKQRNNLIWGRLWNRFPLAFSVRWTYCSISISILDINLRLYLYTVLEILYGDRYHNIVVSFVDIHLYILSIDQNWATRGPGLQGSNLYYYCGQTSVTLQKVVDHLLRWVFMSLQKESETVDLYMYVLGPILYNHVNL